MARKRKNSLIRCMVGAMDMRYEKNYNKNDIRCSVFNEVQYQLGTVYQLYCKNAVKNGKYCNHVSPVEL